MKWWKDLRTNLMYWRFRHITRNQHRLRAWWQRRRPGSRSTPKYPYSPARGMASHVYRGSQRRSWTAFLGMVVALTALTYAAGQWGLPSGLVPLFGMLVICGAIYWALRGV
jgi:hypothetical protein